MIPLAATVRVRAGGRRFGLWLPLFLVWALILPFAVLLSPLFLIGGWALGVRPARAAASVCGVVSALQGVLVEVEFPGARVLVRIY